MRQKQLLHKLGDGEKWSALFKAAVMQHHLIKTSLLFDATVQ